jgi:hypothetical protein
VNVALLLTNLAATLFLTGNAWSLQWVQLPILLRGDYPELVGQLTLHRRLNSRLMGTPMTVEVLTAICLFFTPARGTILILATGALCVILYATSRYTRLHPRLRNGYDQISMKQMREWNFVRALSWTVRSALMLWIVAQRL